MSTVRMLSKDPETHANLVIEGEIAFAYRGQIPGLDGKFIGYHWIFRGQPKVITADCVGNAYLSHGHDQMTFGF